jgi:hypothetical protein
MEQVGQTLGRVGPRAGWAGFEAVLPEPWLPCVYTRRRSPSQWRKLVEADPPGRPAGHHLPPNRPLQVSRGPIHPYKYPPHGESRHTTPIL